MHVQILPWLVQYIQAEKETGGVPPVLEESQEQADGQRIFWHFEHSAWVARVQAPDGRKHRLERCVSRRQKREGLSRAEAKALVYREVEAWAECVEVGPGPGRTHLRSLRPGRVSFALCEFPIVVFDNILNTY